MTLHTDIPTRSELEQLLDVRDPLCVSLYVPTSPLTQEAQAGRIELKTLTADDFWAEQARSLAIFAAPGADVPAAEPAHERGGGGRPLLRQAAAARGDVPPDRVRARGGGAQRRPHRRRGRQGAAAAVRARSIARCAGSSPGGSCR